MHLRWFQRWDLWKAILRWGKSRSWILPPKRRSFNPYPQYVEVPFPGQRYNLARRLTHQGACSPAESTLESHICTPAETQQALMNASHLHVHLLCFCASFRPYQAAMLA